MVIMVAQSSLPSVNWDAQVSIKLLVEAAPLALAIVDQTGRIAYVNSRLEELFGYRREELVGQMVELLMPAQFREGHVQYRLSYVRDPHVRSMGSGMDLAGRRKDGAAFPIEVGLSPFHAGEQSLVIATITDISKRKQAEQLLVQRVEERTREIERRRQVSEGLRKNLKLVISNRLLPEILDFIASQAAQLLGADACVIYRRDERSGRLQHQAAAGHEAGDWAHMLEQLLARKTPLFHEPLVFAQGMQPAPAFSLSSPTASTLPNSLYRSAYLTVPIRDTQGIYGLIVLYFSELREITHEDLDMALWVADQTALAIENAQLRAQIERSAVAAERSRIARDLHDAVTQTLFSASMIAEVLPIIWQRNEEEGRKRLEELRELTRGALAEMRTLLLELRPAKLVEVDLADLLRQLAEAVAGRARVPVTVQVEGEVEVPAEVKVAFYRVAQEALNNVAKHAQASRATIHLQRSPNLIALAIQDDGCGFVFESIAPEHLGLGIMRERAEAIGASLSVQSEPDQGTFVEVRWTNMNTLSERLSASPMDVQR
jgi:PAS domain S-box-containing protein